MCLSSTPITRSERWKNLVSVLPSGVDQVLGLCRLTLKLRARHDSTPGRDLVAQRFPSTADQALNGKTLHQLVATESTLMVHHCRRVPVSLAQQNL